MNVNKLQEAIAELRAEATQCLRLADDLEARVKSSLNGGDPRDIGPVKTQLKLRHKRKASYLSAAVDALRENQKPMHVDDLVPKVAERLRKPKTTRGSVESALVRGIKSGKWHIKRTSPGTFTVA